MSKNTFGKNNNLDKKSRALNDNTRTKSKGIIEDSTEYGEFIASFDAWLTPEEQKARAKHLENLGDKKD